MVGPSVILITGPGGVGKTTVAFEVCRRLEAAGVGHAMIDTDGLDRVFPPPPDDPDKAGLTRRNLAAVWGNLRAAGAPRLVLTAVATSIEDELPLIREAVPGADISVARLLASERDLLERVRRREVGSGYDYQAPRTIEQARLMRQEPADVEPVGEPPLFVIETSGRTVGEVAREILERTGWPPHERT